MYLFTSCGSQEKEKYKPTSNLLHDEGIGDMDLVKKHETWSSKRAILLIDNTKTIISRQSTIKIKTSRLWSHILTRGSRGWPQAWTASPAAVAPPAAAPLQTQCCQERGTSGAETGRVDGDTLWGGSWGRPCGWRCSRRRRLLLAARMMMRLGRVSAGRAGMAAFYGQSSKPLLNQEADKFQ